MSNEELTPTITIKGLTDQQKSVLLAKAMGWRYLAIDGGMYNLLDGEGCPIAGSSVLPSHNLYQPEWMALAWRVLNWWDRKWGSNRHDAIYWNGFAAWWDIAGLWNQEPSTAIRWMLDKILSLAIEAGLIEVNDE